MTLEQLQKEVREKFLNNLDTIWKKTFAYQNREYDDSILECIDTLIAKAYEAGQHERSMTDISLAFESGEQSGKEKEAQEWLHGRRCDNCGRQMERDPLSTMCAACWEDE